MVFMNRSAINYLLSWRDSPRRKPLVMRGARQVGKSHLAASFAERYLDGAVTIDFEQTPEAAALFSDKRPEKIISRLELFAGRQIVPGRTLLFLDEIQASPEVLASLRYFYEQIPSLHVMAAGSLLEFVLREHSFSMPVGRIEYLNLGPLTFEEYLAASGRSGLAVFLTEYSLGDELPPVIHGRLMEALREFLVVGGMPEAARAFIDTGSYIECDKIKQAILSTYRDDFAKYGGRGDIPRLRQVFQKLPRLVGGKFIYSHVDREARARDIGGALNLLFLARVAGKVRRSAANDVPLAAEADDRKFKVLFLDVGLMCRACGLGLLDFELDDVVLVNSGAVCEQFIGQHLFHAGHLFEEPELYYWSREKRQSSAEIDYLLSMGREIIPVEVKAGKTGRLKSLHIFLEEKVRRLGLRFNAGYPSLLDDTAVLSSGQRMDYRLLSLPMYMVGQTGRLLKSCVRE